MAITSYSLSPMAEDILGMMTFQALTLVDSSGTLSMSGGVHFGIHMSEAAQSQGTLLRANYVVNNLPKVVVSKQGTTGQPSDTFTYSDGYEVHVDSFIPSVPVAASETIGVNGKFRSEALGGELTLKTMSGFTLNYTGAVGEVFPSSGQLLVSGRSNTAIGLTATGTAQIRQDMCDDGDGVWEATKMVTWDWLIQ
jgi:hypothetical protein